MGACADDTRSLACGALIDGVCTSNRAPEEGTRSGRSGAFGATDAGRSLPGSAECPYFASATAGGGPLPSPLTAVSCWGSRTTAHPLASVYVVVGGGWSLRVALLIAFPAYNMRVASDVTSHTACFVVHCFLHCFLFACI